MRYVSNILTMRENPADVNELRQQFRAQTREIVRLGLNDKLPEDIKEPLTSLMHEQGNNLGLDYDLLIFNAIKNFEGQKEKASQNTEIELGKRDLELSAYSPIELTTAQRAEANDAALQVLQKEDRAITPPDIETLRKYTGNGGLKGKAYQNEEQEGKKRGALNEHYTSYAVIQMIWDKLQQMGVDRGNILEPGAGIGNFAGFLPDHESMKMLMVEQSVVSSRIASLLYPKEKVVNSKFQYAELSEYNLTGVIGNVPFGDYRITPKSSKFAELNPPIHDYFILKSLDSLQPGGWMAVITSIGTMDKKNAKYRKAMIKMAGLVGAYRLPSTAFKANADTLVTTDLLIFQKYNGNKGAYQDNNDLFANQSLSVETGRFGKENKQWDAYYNPYYDEYPGRILGEHIQGHNVQFPTRMGVKGKINQETIKQVVDDGLGFVHDLPDKQSFYAIPEEGVRLDTDRDYHAGNIVYHNNKFYEKQRLYFKPINIGKDDKAGEAARERIKSACLLLDKYAEFVTALAQNSDNTESLRNEFNSKLDNYVDTFGIPDEDKRIREIFKYDNRLYKLTTFVKRDPLTDELIYADILNADKLYSDNYKPEISNTNNLAAVANFGHNIGETLDEDFYLSTWKGGTGTPDELKEAFSEAENFFWNPDSEKYEFRYEYLAGDVRKKLQTAEEKGLEKNAEALNEVLPEWIDIFKIQSDPRHIFTYLPPDVLKKFVTGKLGYGDAELGVVKDKAELGNRFYMRLRTGGWRGKYVKPGDESQKDENTGWGTLPFSKILNTYIQERKFPFVPFDLEGRKLTISKKDLKAKAEESEEYQKVLDNSLQKQNANNERMLNDVPRIFNTWLRTDADADVRDKVEQVYNDKYNSTINPPFDGSTLKFRGMSDTFYGDADFRVFKHNRVVAEKLVWNGRGANNHDVGAGKTMASIITNQVLLQQGSAHKSLFVVPGKVQEKWVEEYTQLFPDAKILNMKMEKESKHKELTMAQLYDWDAIFIADHSFKRIQLSPGEQQKRLQQRIAYFDELLENMDEVFESEKGVKNTQKSRIAKNIEKQKEEFEKKVFDLKEANILDSDIFFDQLGIDAIFFDEAHFYKNALSSPKAQKLGIAATNTSIRAEDALQKTQWLYDQIGYRNVFVLTATPVVNSPIEVWHMLNLCAPDVLEKYDISNLDNFINLYVKTEQKLVKKTTGDYKQEMVVSGYVNLPEMRTVINEVMDIKSYDQLIQSYKDNPDYYLTEDGTKKPLQPQFRRPNRNDETDIIEQSEIHELLFDDVILRAENVLECMKSRECETKDNFLVITGDGSKISTDLRVYDNDFEGIQDRYLKLGDLVENVKNSYGLRTNPAPQPVPDSIYGDYFNRIGRKRLRTNPDKTTFRNQIIFCDWITIKDQRAGSFHALIKSELVSAGIPKKEIAIINGNTIGTKKNGSNYRVKSKDDKEELKKQVQDDFNEGKYRIIIGNKSIAEGMNLQKWTTDIHHMDVPYTPSEIQQRNGRGLRQGNQWEDVSIHFYLMEDSFDQYRLELVAKKQNWIDELFFGSDRESGSHDEAESMNYQEMVAATNSDPRVKKFFNAKSNAQKLKHTIKNDREERDRLKRSLDTAKEDIEHKQQTFSETISRERKLSEITLPDSPQRILQHNKLDIDYSNFGGYIRSIEDHMTDESRYLTSTRLNADLDIPQNSANGRFLFQINPPAESGQRQFYNKRTWGSIKKMAKEGLEKSFGWNPQAGHSSGRSLTANTPNILADQDDFYDYYGIDVEARRESDDDLTWDRLKSEIGMNNFDRWKPIVGQKLAQLFLILDRAWKQGARGRIERIEDHLKQAKKTKQSLKDNLVHTTDKLQSEQEREQQLIQTQNELADVVNDLVKTRFESRRELYGRLNEIAPKFGVTSEIDIRDLDDVFSGEEAAPGGTVKQETVQTVDEESGEVVETQMPQKAANFRHNPDADLIYLGIGDKIKLSGSSEDDYLLEGPFAMLTNEAMDRLYFPKLSSLKNFKGTIDDKKADQAFKVWHSYQADGQNFSMPWPDDAKPVRVGTADELIYISDKLMQPDDRKGHNHRYIHQFDLRKRPAYVKGNILIIKNLKINQRGILN